MVIENVTKPKRRMGCVGLFFAILIVSAIVLGIGAAVSAVFFPNILASIVSSLTGISAPQTRGVPGDAARFDPIAGLADIQAFAGDGAQFTHFAASDVRADGTLDLTASYNPGPRVTFDFVREVPRPSDAPPVGSAGTGPGPWYERVTITASRPGERRRFSSTQNGVRTSFDYVNDGLLREVAKPSTSLPYPLATVPKCSFADLWKAALKREVSKDAVARIEYAKEGYSFTISTLSVYLKFDANCKLLK